MELLGKIYEKKRLSSEYMQSVEADWWVALEFMLGHSFMRDRKDENSISFLNQTLAVIKEVIRLEVVDRDAAYRNLVAMRPSFDKSIIKAGNKEKVRAATVENAFVQDLMTVRTGWKKQYNRTALGHYGDITMVLGMLEFITRDTAHKNAYLYIKQRLGQVEVKEVYEDLHRIGWISDKLGAFIIRDVCMANHLIIQSGKQYVFPVDTWVDKMASKFGMPVVERESPLKRMRRVKKFFIEKIQTPTLMYVAAGLWLFGRRSLDILMEVVDRYDILFDLLTLDSIKSSEF